jgi:hypothetical protein
MILAFSKSVQSARELSVVASRRCGPGRRTNTSSSRSRIFATNLPLTAMLADAVACWLACCLPPQWAWSVENPADQAHLQQFLPFPRSDCAQHLSVLFGNFVTRPCSTTSCLEPGILRLGHLFGTRCSRIPPDDEVIDQYIYPQVSGTVSSVVLLDQLNGHGVFGRPRHKRGNVPEM